MTWPEGVTAAQPEAGEKPSGIEPWPETWRDAEGSAMLCLHCRYYAELSGPPGADWGACTNERSQYDGELVFEHWTCSHWADVSAKACILRACILYGARLPYPDYFSQKGHDP
jgi:hypothetical protein